jgi:hypothetical protein
MFLFFIPFIIFSVLYIASFAFQKINDADDIFYENITKVGISSTYLTDKDDGIVVVQEQDILKPLKCRSYHGRIQSNSKVILIDYDKEKNIYMVEPYV